MKIILAILLCASTLQAAGPSLATAAAVSTLAANADSIVHSIHHPKSAAQEIGAHVKRAVTFRRNDGKLRTLPVPHAPVPPIPIPVH